MSFRLIGLTGGIAAGKTTVASLIRAHGIPVLNLDEIGKEITGPHLATLLEKATGTSVMAHGQIDRAKLRALIFSNPEIRKAVEQVLHPLILQEFKTRCDALQKEGHAIVVCEAALLVDSGHYHDMDELVVVTATDTARKKRLGERDKIEAELIEQIFSHQTSDAEKIKVATTVITNDGSREHLKAQVDAVVMSWK